jgi:hypothetical protein
MLALLATAWAATALGCAVARRLRPGGATGAEVSVFGAAVGLGALAYAVQAVGLVGLLRTPVLVALVAACAALGLREHWPLLQTLLRGVAAWLRLGPADVAIGMACGLLLLLMALGAAAPPSGNDWDGLSYHLAVPKVYLSHGRVLFIPYDHHSNFPFAQEMLYTLGLAFAGVGPARLFHTLMGALCAAAVALLWRRLTGPRLMTLPALLLLSSPMVAWCGTVAYNDLALALYVFLAAYGVVAWLISTEANAGQRAIDARGWLMLAGVCAGFALGVKMTAMIPVALLALWIAMPARGAQPRPARTRALVLFLLPAVAVGAPWYVRSWVWTGNPVYPFFYSVFGGTNWNAQAAAMYAQEQASYGVGRSLAAILMLPYTLTFHPELFSKGVGVFGSPGPFALGLLVLLPLTRPVARKLAGLGWIALGYGVVWILLSQQSRYLVPIMPMLAMLAAWVVARYGAASVPEAGRWLRLGLGTLLACQTAVLAWLVWTLVAPGLPVVLGAEPAEQYLSRTLEVYPAERWINEHTPRDAKVLLFEETRGFYLDRQYMWANPGHHTLIPYERFRTPGDMLAYFRAHGFSYILLNRMWTAPTWGSSGWSRLLSQAMGGPMLPLVYRRGPVEVYRITPNRRATAR